MAVAIGMGLMANAQTNVFSDDFEGHNVGTLFGGNWSNWSLTNDADLNMAVTDFRASSGTKSGFIGPQNENNGQDALLKFPGVYSSGKVTTEWKVFVPTDSVAYYNLQETATPGESYAFECYINTYGAEDTLSNGTSLQHNFVWLFTPDTTTYLFAYAPVTTNQWVTLKQVMDFDAGKLSLFVDGTEVTYFQPQTGNSWPGTKKSAGAIDFFSYSNDNAPDLVNSYYIDDVSITTEGVSGINDVEKNSKLISAYPNPCKEYINLSANDQTITNVDVFNVFGQKVMTANTKSSIAKLNTQSLASGIYTAKVTTKDGTFTKKFTVK